MALAFTPPTPDPAAFDRILLAGGSSATLDLLRLATIRTDEVVLFAEQLPPAAQSYAGRFAVEWVRRRAGEADVIGSNAVLIAEDDCESANALVRASRRAGIPVHVSGRPLVSDFSLLEFLERRPTTQVRSSERPS